METAEAVAVERLQHQKHNRGDDGHVGQRASHVIGETGGCGRDRTRGTPSGSARTLRTCCSIGDLCSTDWTKNHRGLLRETTGKLSERSSWRNGGPLRFRAPPIFVLPS